MLKRILVLAVIAQFPIELIAQDKVGSTAAQFLGITAGARPSAMGGAYVALSDDANGMYWNPAGIARVSKNTLSFSNMDWFVDTQIQDGSVVVNGDDLGNFALSVRSINYGEIAVTTPERPTGTGELFTPTDLSIALTYSKFITDKFSIGASTRFVQQKIWNVSSNGFAVDLGMIYQTDFRNMRIGMSILNFGTDMKLEGDDLRRPIDIDESIESNNDRIEAFLGVDEWPMPLVFRVGIALDLIQLEDHSVLFALDAKHPNDNSESLDVGVEYGFKNLLYLRGGYRSLFSSQSEDQSATMGFGLNYEFNGVNTEFGAAYMTHEYLNNPLMWTIAINF